MTFNVRVVEAYSLCMLIISMFKEVYYCFNYHDL